MPKLKTRRSIKKRFRITKSGKVVKMRPSKSHLLSKKPRKRKRFLKKPSSLLSKVEAATIKRMLPYE